MIKLTNEQNVIINCDIPQGGILKIVAGSGCGKTHTLIEFAKARPHNSFLYVCFNKANQIEAEKKFGRFAECRTGHSLGWGTHGVKYKPIQGFLRANIVRSEMKFDSNVESKGVLETLTRYHNSADNDIEIKHIPKSTQLLIGSNVSNKFKFLNKVNLLWSAMKDKKNKKIGMTFDGYLKLYQLSKPVLKYDYILLDEAQYTNPVLADIILSQILPTKIIVGDSHQQIYSFRGSRDFIQKTKADITLYLSNSFRFPQNIADIANKIQYSDITLAQWPGDVTEDRTAYLVFDFEMNLVKVFINGELVFTKK